MREEHARPERARKLINKRTAGAALLRGIWRRTPRNLISISALCAGVAAAWAGRSFAGMGYAQFPWGSWLMMMAVLGAVFMWMVQIISFGVALDKPMARVVALGAPLGKNPSVDAKEALAWMRSLDISRAAGLALMLLFFAVNRSGSLPNDEAFSRDARAPMAELTVAAQLSGQPLSEMASERFRASATGASWSEEKSWAAEAARREAGDRLLSVFLLAPAISLAATLGILAARILGLAKITQLAREAATSSPAWMRQALAWLGKRAEELLATIAIRSEKQEDAMIESMRRRQAMLGSAKSPAGETTRVAGK